jgi:hypothetical protein
VLKRTKPTSTAPVKIPAFGLIDLFVCGGTALSRTCEQTARSTRQRKPQSAAMLSLPASRFARVRKCNTFVDQPDGKTFVREEKEISRHCWRSNTARML